MTTERNTKNTSSVEEYKGPRQPVSLWQWFPKAMKEELQKSMQMQIMFLRMKVRQ